MRNNLFGVRQGVNKIDLALQAAERQRYREALKQCETILKDCPDASHSRPGGGSSSKSSKKSTRTDHHDHPPLTAQFEEVETARVLKCICLHMLQRDAEAAENLYYLLDVSPPPIAAMKSSSKVQARGPPQSPRAWTLLEDFLAPEHKNACVDGYAKTAAEKCHLAICAKGDGLALNPASASFEMEAELVKYQFLSCLKKCDFVAAERIAMRFYSKLKSPRYVEWCVVCVLLDKNANKTRLMLAERMLDQAIQKVGVLWTMMGEFVML